MYLSQEQAIVLAVLVASLLLFMWGRWRYDLVALAALLAVTLCGLVPPDGAFAGFGHPAVITVAAVLVLSKGLFNSGAVDLLARWLSRLGDRPAVQLVALTTLVAVSSGFMNNVGALALMIPVAAWLARRSGYSPSWLLMPLAFGSLLGGMTTLIGTPPNIIIASFREQSGAEPFGMFDFLPVGGGVMLVGLATTWILAKWVMPEREAPRDNDKLFTIDEYLAEVRVPPKSKMVGRTIHDLEASVDDDADAAVVGLIRDGKKALVPSPYAVLQADDILLVEAAPDDLKTLLDTAGLQLAESQDDAHGLLKSDDVTVVEAVVSHNSRLIGTTAAAIDLRSRYAINLLAIARHGQQLRKQLSRIRFAIGDILLLQGREAQLSESLNRLGCLPLAERQLRVGKPRRVFLAAGIFLAGITATTIGLLPVQIALVSAALVMVLSNVVPLREAYEAIDWPILLLLGAMIPVGEAFETTGTAQLLADRISVVAGWGGPSAALSLLLVATMLLSNVINNAAAAVLMAPIAISIAQSLASSVDPFLMAVAVGASAAFLTPIGHQSNTLVMEPGGYRFNDYWRLGLPVSLAVVLAAIPLILWAWPL